MLQRGRETLTDCARRVESDHLVYDYNDAWHLNHSFKRLYNMFSHHIRMESWSEAERS